MMISWILTHRFHQEGFVQEIWRYMLTTSVAPIIGSAIGYRPIIAIVQYIGCLSDSTYRYSIYAAVYF